LHQIVSVISNEISSQIFFEDGSVSSLNRGKKIRKYLKGYAFYMEKLPERNDLLKKRYYL
jgi:hypothetical protein